MTAQQLMPVSDTLRLMIDAFADHYTNSKELAARIAIQATQEHIPANIVRDMIAAALKQRHLSQRQIYRAIPAEFKNAARVANGALRPAKNRQLPADTMSVKPAKTIEPIHYLKIEPCYFLDFVPFIQDRRTFYLRCQGAAVMQVLDSEEYNAIVGAGGESSE